MTLIYRIKVDDAWTLTCNYGNIAAPKVVLWSRSDVQYGPPKVIWMATGNKSVLYNKVRPTDANSYEAVDQDTGTFSRYHSIELKHRHFRNYKDMFFTCTVFNMDHVEEHPMSVTRNLYPQSKFHACSHFECPVFFYASNGIMFLNKASVCLCVCVFVCHCVN